MKLIRRRPFHRLRQFAREYTEGMSTRDFRRLFDRDAAHQNLSVSPISRAASVMGAPRFQMIGITSVASLTF